MEIVRQSERSGLSINVLCVSSSISNIQMMVFSLFTENKLTFCWNKSVSVSQTHLPYNRRSTTPKDVTHLQFGVKHISLFFIFRRRLSSVFVQIVLRFLIWTLKVVSPLLLLGLQEKFYPTLFSPGNLRSRSVSGGEHWSTIWSSLPCVNRVCCCTFL